MDQLRQRIQMQNPPSCAPKSNHAWGQAQPSVAQKKQRYANCQKNRCNIQDCPIMKLVGSMMPQEEECRAKDNLASILCNIKAMSVKDRQGMIMVLFEKESTMPAKIQACQVGSIKPMTKEQLRKCLWQHSAEEQKEIGLLFRQSSKSPERTTSVQIHMLQIAKQPEKSPVVQVQIVKTKTKKQVKRNLQ